MEATFSAAVELDRDLLVHVLAQVEDVFLLGPVVLLTVARRSSTATSGSAPSSPVAASASSSSSSSASELTAVRHGFVGGGIWIEGVFIRSCGTENWAGR